MTKIIKAIAFVIVIGMSLSLMCSCHIHKSSGKVTCTQDEICTSCGEVLHAAQGHKALGPATCTADSVCSVCGEIIEAAHGHTHPDVYDCTKGEYCAVCGELITPACEHTVSGEATCTENSYCTVCGTVLEAARGHKPDSEASCTHASVCTVCGEELNKALGHTPGPEATETTPQVCTVCGTILKPATGSLSPDYIDETVSNGHYVNNIKAYYSGNILVCGNYGMEYFGAKSSGNSTYAEMVNAFAEKFPAVSVNCMIVPKCASFQSPEGYTDQFENHKAFIEATYALTSDKVKTPDAFGKMAEHRGEYLFYRTDHHWTSLGAYYASVAFCETNGITPRALSSYETVINTDFMGTLYGYCVTPKPTTFIKDYTVGHMPAVGYTMTYTTDGKTYKGSAINKNAKSYASMFICGDQAFTDIVTENKNGRKLIVFKESYGNGYVPYMIDYFEEIIVIDIRKDTESIAKIISDYGITDALIINNIQAVSSLQSKLQNKLVS